MKQLVRDRIELWFADLGTWIHDHRWITLLTVLGLSFPFLYHLPGITVDNRTERMFLEGDSALGDYLEFREQFGTDEYIVVALQPPEVFTMGFLEDLRRMHRELEARVPYVAEVSSLVNARTTTGVGDTLVVDDLLASWPEDEAALASLRERVMANPFYRDRLIAEDGSLATILIRPRSVALPPESEILAGFDDEAPVKEEARPDGRAQLSSVEFAEMVTAVEDVVAGFRGHGYDILLAGAPVVTDAINRAVPRDLARLLPISLLVVAFFLFLTFRRPSGVVYPMVIVLLALLSTLGFMAMAGLPMTNITTMLTSFLLVVGVADSVHILSRFYQRLHLHGDHRAAISEALHHSGLAVLMTSLTTATGLLSFVVADVRPIAELGIVAPVGVGFALLYTLTLLPAMLAIVPANPAARHRHSARMDRFLAAITTISCTRARTILAVSAVIAVLAVSGMTHLRFSQNGLKWFKSSSPVRVATERIDAGLGGTLSIEVVIDTGRSNGLHDPDFLARLDDSMAWAESLEQGEVYVAKASSLETIVKEINRALNQNDDDFYALPDSRELVAQELLLFEGTGADDLEQVVDRDFRMVRATLTVPFRDAFKYVAMVDEVRDHFAAVFPSADITVTGSNALYVKMFHNVITTMAKSYAISLTVITVLMILLLGRLGVGLLSMVPNLLPLAAILGIMGWMEIPLDVSTVLVGSVAIGLVVDDTIHFMHNFRRDFEQLGTVRDAVGQTLHTAGRAILITSLVLAGGFYACMVSELRSSVIYGGLMGTTILLALAADYFVTPALMQVFFGGAGRTGSVASAPEHEEAA